MNNKTKITIVVIATLIISISFIIGCAIIGNSINDGLSQIGKGILNA
jgi:hypothetical protein